MASAQTLQIPGFQVMEFLGSGARSTIWRVRDRRSGELFALKRVVRRHRSGMRFLQQAINEYTVGSALNHPVVRRILRLRRVKRWLSLREVLVVMELCEGKTIHENRPSNIREVLNIFSQVAAGLAAMNAAGYVHADIKPNNIIVGPQGVVKIIDLGQSCPLGTIKDRIQGTPDFIAPEQVHRRPLDARTDAFNFGAALYWTLTGRPIPTILPKSATAITLMKDLAVTPAEELNPAVPAPLSKLVTDCIAMAPQQRPASMAEVQSRIEMIIQHVHRNETKRESPLP